MKINLLSVKKQYLLVGRGATAIWLALKSRGYTNKGVVVPANVCYAAVYPILLSGNYPVFCDVDVKSGNIALQNVKSVWADEVSAIIIPHMFGNPVADIVSICDFAHKNNALVIEDCASSMGAFTPDGMTGSFGDFVVYSTGHSKTIDIGNGGILCADEIGSKIIELYNNLPVYNEGISKDDAFFSKLYRLIRNQPDTSWTPHIYKALSALSEKLFLYRATDSLEKQILQSLNALDEIVEQRKAELALYDELISPNEKIEKYQYSDGASPWRYNIFVSPDIIKDFIGFLLSNGIPVSDWYPNVTPLFFENKPFRNASLLEQRILNFPLLIGKEKIQDFCKVINSFFR